MARSSEGTDDSPQGASKTRDAVGLGQKVSHGTEEFCSQVTVTPREHEIVQRYKSLRSVRKVSEALGVREDTVRTHLRKIRDKAGLDSTADLQGECTIVARKSKSVNKPGTITASMLRDLVERQRFRCALSGVQLTPESASLDHKIPLSRGGEHVIENVWWVTKDVNAAKGTMSDEEFIAMCRLVVANADSSRHCHPTNGSLEIDALK